MARARSEMDGLCVDKKDGSVVANSDVIAFPALSLDVQQSLWQNIKKYRKVVYIALGLTSPIVLYGYDYVIVGTVSGMPGFQYCLPLS